MQTIDISYCSTKYCGIKEKYKYILSHIMFFTCDNNKIECNIIPCSSYEQFKNGMAFYIKLNNFRTKKLFLPFSEDKYKYYYKASNRRKNFKYIWEE